VHTEAFLSMLKQIRAYSGMIGYFSLDKMLAPWVYHKTPQKTQRRSSYCINFFEARTDPFRHQATYWISYQRDAPSELM
jgi:hypothetical protein